MSRIQARRRRIGPLDTIEFEGSSPDSPTIVLFHGFGADCTDLASLAQMVQAPKGSRWIFPNGHLTVPLGPHMEGRAWFPISISELEKAMALGTGADFSATEPPGLRRAREMAKEMIAKLNVPPERLVLGGFSQGAMLATELVLGAEKPLAGLVILSGTLVNASAWEPMAAELSKKKPGFAFFQSHGAHDPVLSIAMAERLERTLRKAGLQGQLMRFHGGHEIPPEVLIQLGGFLRKALA